MVRVSQRRLSNPPWKRARDKAPNHDTLKDWRRVAAYAATQKGGRRACGLCKRATMGQASITIRQPWPSKTQLKRWLCSGCYTAMTQVVAELEAKLDNYDLPIDKVGQGFTKGSGQRGTFVS